MVASGAGGEGEPQVVDSGVLPFEPTEVDDICLNVRVRDSDSFLYGEIWTCASGNAL